MIQIQPKYQQKEEWLSYAERNGLSFEVLELSTIWLGKSIPQEILEWYQKCGKVQSIHGAFMDCYPVSPDQEIREISRKRCEESCRLADFLGAENIVFHSTALPFVRGGLEVSWGKDAAEYYQELADRYDKKIYIENFNDIDYIPMLRMMQNVTDERVKICLDIGHANYTRIPLETWLESLQDHIGYLHISDNLGLWDDHFVLGEGSVKFQVLDKWLQKQQEKYPVTLEVPSLESVEKSLAYLKAHHFLEEI